ncbi:MAG: hypothetical protein CBD47_05560 [Synechococcus sp. TMED187]|nr:hypothetical protein [Synechococcus sp. NAT40]OUW46883.1 MAG: hypothetical protein CBD47_05560 [Synechococcus sp. TMED187]
MNGVNDDNKGTQNQRCSRCYKINVVRFALSLGMLLGISHGWVMSENLAQNKPSFLNTGQSVNSDTDFSPFSSGSHHFFSY